MNKLFAAVPIAQNTGLLLVRIITGIFLVYHGWEIFNTAKMNEYLLWDNFNNSNGKLLIYAGKGAELVAGILFVGGLFTRLASLFTIGTMCYIAFFLGNGIIWNNDQHPFLFVLLALVFIFTGPGRYSLDNYLFKPKSRS
jgi:putative oxidoreductase